MEEEDNIALWQRLFNTPLQPKSYNNKYNCQEYASSCPKCGGTDRLSVYGGSNGIIAMCWGPENGRSGCGKRFYRRDYISASKPIDTTPKPSAVDNKHTQEILSFLDQTRLNIQKKDHTPTLLYAKQRGFSADDIETFQLGSTFKQGKGFGLVLPVYDPKPYYQIRWMQWNAGKPHSKYQNPPGKRPSHALFSTGSDTCLVFESLIDAMLIHTKTGYSTIAAMGASLKDRVLTSYEELYLVPDQDSAGDRNFGLKGRYTALRLPKGYKDIGGLIEKHGPTTAKLFLEKLIENKRKEREIKTKQAPPKPLKKEELEPKKEHFKNADKDAILKDAELKIPRGGTPPFYVYITTKNEAKEAVKKFLKTEEIIALDTETTGLNFREDTIRLVQLFVPSLGCYMFDLFKIGESVFLKPLESKHFIIHYAPFDVKFLGAMGVHLKNYEDTKLLAALTYPLPNPKSEKRQNLENVSQKYLQRSLSLKGLLKTYLDIEMEKESHTRLGWEGELSQEKLDYAAKDVLHLHALYRSLKYKIDNYGFKEIYPHYLEGLRAHIAMEALGAPIRKEALTKAIEDLDPLEDCTAFIEKYGIANPNSNKQLSDYVSEVFPGIALPTTKGGQLKLGKEALKELDHPDPFFQDLKSYRKKVTAHKEHLKLHEAICPLTGRVFASFNLLGASSGRTITVDPNFQGQSNSVKPFVGFSGEGTSRITAADYSQQELRIFSLLTKNVTFLKLLSTGEDGYKGVAAVVLDKPIGAVTKDERKLFKVVTLALLYGRGVKSFAKDLQMKEEEAKALYIQVKDTLFVDHLKEHLVEEHKSQGHVLTVFGETKRPIKDIWRTLKEYQLINYCIQGTASNIGLLALNKIEKVRDKGIKVIGYIHDEFLLEHEAEKTQEVHSLVEACMVEAFIACFPQAEDQKNYLVEIKTDRRWIK